MGTCTAATGRYKLGEVFEPLPQVAGQDQRLGAVFPSTKLAGIDEFVN